MLDNSILAFIIMVSLMVMSPGPNGALILKNVSTAGKQHGYVNVLGIVVAFYLHGLLSALGVSAIIVSSAELFLVIKILGAIYLAYLGGKAILNAINSMATGHSVDENLERKVHDLNSQHRVNLLSPRRYRTSFFEGLLTNLLNPKVSIFYLAAFPQFMETKQDALLSAAGLVTIHALIALLWFSMMVKFIAKSKQAIANQTLQRILQTAVGGFLLWFSYRVATSK